MKINRTSKKELREIIAKKLRDVPDGERIKLDKEVLEALLFDEIILDSEKKIKLKLPVWSGGFLRKLDLSEVDFTDVSWRILDNDMESESENEINYSNINIKDKSVIERIRKIKKQHKNRGWRDKFAVRYDGTNANIDLTKSFEAIHCNHIYLSSCNFNGLDFSKQDLSGRGYLYFKYSDITGTNLSIPSNIPLFGYQSSLEGIDLSDRMISIYSYVDVADDFLHDCNLRNTGIHINIDEEYSKKIKKEKYVKSIQNAMKYNWVGCYVNDKKILPVNVKKAMASEMKEKYREMEDEYFNSVLDSIDEQVRKKCKKI